MEMEIIIKKRISRGNFTFSLASLLSSLLLLILIISKKELHSLTYKFLMYIFISEIINSVGNIIQSYDSYENKYNKRKIVVGLISFSDLFTYILFLFFAICSRKIIKESNKEIKRYITKFIIISTFISFLYLIIMILISVLGKNTFVDIRFREYYRSNSSLIIADNTSKSTTNNNSDLNSDFQPLFFICSSVHLIIIMVITFFIFLNIYKVLVFMKEKLKTDKVNSEKIVKLFKNLLRYSLICILYWIFALPRLILVYFCGEDNQVRDMFYLFSETFFSIRGLLIFLNTLMNTKIQLILSRFFEVNIKHYLLLKFDKSSSNKKGLEVPIAQEDNSKSD